MGKIRKQFYIDKWMIEELQKYAAEGNTSEADIVREAVVEYISKRRKLPKDNPLSKLVDLGSSGTKDSIAVDHDKHLYLEQEDRT